MTEIFKLSPQYVAGIIDGDGCIGFSYTTTRKIFAIRVAVSMTEPDVPQLLFEQFGGQLYEKKFKNKNSRVQLNWCVVGVAAANFLLVVEPYLIVKKKQAGLAMLAQKLKLEGTLDEELIQAFIRKMHILNKRGV